MKYLKIFLVALVIFVNLLIAKPSFADPPKFTTNPDYIEVTQSLDKLLKVKNSSELPEGVTQEDIQKSIADLEFQKYALESGINWGQCRNETGKTLAIYGAKPKKSTSTFDNAIYFLADGETTNDEWDCDGIYLPGGIKVAGLSNNGKTQELANPVAVKILNGTQLVVKANPDTGAVELNVPPAKIFSAGDANWFIPNISPDAIAARIPNAPTIEND